MTRIFTTFLVTLLLTPVLAPQPAFAETDFSKFPLTKAIPADAFVAVASRANPERQFLKDHWAGVWQALRDSGIVQDVWDMVVDNLSDEQVETVEGIQSQFSKHFEKVDWGQLFEKESLHVGRFVSQMGPTGPYEGLMLGRMDAKRAEENYNSLKAILEEVVKFADSQGANGALRIVETKTDGLTVAGLVPPGVQGPVLAVGYSKDIIAVTFGGHTLLGECMDLLSGKSEKPGLVSTERFKNAFAKLPAAEDELVFFDPSRMFGTIGNMMKMFAGMAGGGQATAPADSVAGEEQANGGEVNEIAQVMGGIAKLLEDLAIFDYMAGVQWTDGHRVFNESVTALKADAKKSPLHGVFAAGTEASSYERFVPKEATTFSCGSGISLKKLYQYLRGFVRQTVPDAEVFLGKFDQMQKEVWELDIEKDILDLFEGPTVSIQMKDDWVMMFKVTSEKAAETRLQDLLGRLNAMLGQEGGLTLTTADLGGDVKFTQINHPMMMFMGGMQPVVGTAEGQLIVGSNMKAVRRCLDTAKGKHANITKNKRWGREGLKPAKGQKVDAISFTDESRTAEELQATIGIISMAMGFATMGMQDAPPQVQTVVQAIPPILAKLGPVAAKMDFFKSSAEVSTFDGSKWITRSVQNYKPPKKPEDENGDDDSDEAP